MVAVYDVRVSIFIIIKKFKNIDVKIKKNNIKLNCIEKVKKPKQITISNA